MVQKLTSPIKTKYISRSAHLPSRLAQRWARRYFLEPVCPGSKDIAVRLAGSQPKPPAPITSYQRQLVITEPAATTTVRRRDELTGSQGAGSHGAREYNSSKTFLSCIIINYTTRAYNCLSDLSHTYASTLYYSLSTACAAAFIRRGWPTGSQPSSGDQMY